MSPTKQIPKRAVHRENCYCGCRTGHGSPKVATSWFWMCGYSTPLCSKCCAAWSDCWESAHDQEPVAV